jgi:hypothetical protein
MHPWVVQLLKSTDAQTFKHSNIQNSENSERNLGRIGIGIATVVISSKIRCSITVLLFRRRISERKIASNLSFGSVSRTILACISSSLITQIALYSTEIEEIKKRIILTIRLAVGESL